MKILVACEYSGEVGDRLSEMGHDVTTCDTLPTEGKTKHYQGDVLDILNDGWDMLIAFPPCTHLAVSGASHFKAKQADGRQQEGIDFFLALANADIPMIAIENPVGIMSSKWRKPDQIIQPYQFGHDISKTTCLWLKNLPKLKPTEYVPPSWFNNQDHPRWSNQTPKGQDKTSPSPERGKLRSKTYSGIAQAMADQWGSLPNNYKEVLF